MYEKKPFQKNIIAIACIMLFGGWLTASPVDMQKALTVAQHFWQQKGRGGSALHDLTPEVPVNNLYIFGDMNGPGFVIVAADDVAMPVLGYALNGFFPTEEMCPALLSWLRFYDEQITWAQQLGQTSPAIQQSWEAMLANEPMQGKFASEVAPLVTTTWNQRPLYNELCPADSTLPTGHPATGCTATAMAQLMKYWNHPRQGHGSYAYSWEGEQPFWAYGTLIADFENTVYDWQHMPNRVDWNSSVEEIHAVAQLMSHVGISIQMSYNLMGDGGSDAPVALLEFSDSMYLNHTYCPENALPHFFGYKASLRGLAREGIADTTWDNMLREDISHGRPVLYGGFGLNPQTGEPNGGHCFLLDGYDNNGYFHVNWGWNGAYDGYFTTTALNPASYIFSDRQEAIFGVEPDYQYLETASDMDMVAAICLSNCSGNFYFNYSVANRGDSTFNGVVGIGLVNDEGTQLGYINNNAVTIEPDGVYTVLDERIEFPTQLISGHTYTFMLMYGDSLPTYPVNAHDFTNYYKWTFPGTGLDEEQLPSISVYAYEHNIVVTQETARPVTIYDALGKVVYQNNHPQDKLLIPISTAGFYVVKTGEITTKVVIP